MSLTSHGATYRLPYGRTSTLEFEAPREVRVIQCAVPHGEPLADVQAAARAALAQPLHYPSLIEATVPGDHIALALSPDVPSAPALVAAVINTLLAGGRAAPGDITLVLAADTASEASATSLLSPDVRAEMHIVRHDPTNTGGLMYLAASADARPIYVNRTLGEADVVVPIGCLHPSGTLGDWGIYASLFPTFADAATQEHIYSLAGRSTASEERRRRAEIREAGWMLGCRFTVDVVPGAGDTPLAVLAGDIDAVAERGRELCAAAWHCELAEPAELVLAGISGPNEQQNWNSAARALAAAAAAVADDGAIVLCSELHDGLSRHLQALGRIEDDAVAEKFLRRDHSATAPLGALLLQLRHRARIYLLSDLPADPVEDAGFIPLDSAASVTPLVRRAASCLLLPHAQHVQVVLPS